MTASKTFVDSNIFIYLLSDDSDKRTKADQLLLSSHNISTQVIIESVNYCLNKLKLSKEDSFSFGKKLLLSHDVRVIVPSTLELAFELSLQYQFSWWDSLIVAAALETGSEILYTEDLQNSQVIRDQLTIINPFK